MNIIDRVLFSAEDIEKRVREIAKDINTDYLGQSITLVCVLRGSVMFLSDLCKHLYLPAKIECIQASSYLGGTVSSGEVEIVSSNINFRGQNVIIVEDIVDTGRTMKKLIDKISNDNPASIEICTLLDKPERREEDIKPDYIGFTIGKDDFVLGYGLDYNEYYRNLPYVGVVKDAYK